MASQLPNLTERELKVFKNNGMAEDMTSINRRIGKRLNHREEKWTTLCSEYQEQKHYTAKHEYYNQQETMMPKSERETKAVMDPGMTQQRGQEKGAGTALRIDQGMAYAQQPSKIVLLGPEGGGKSALGNLLVGTNMFQVATTSRAGLESCESEVVTYDYQDWEVVDTPGSPFNHPTTSTSRKFWGSKQADNPGIIQKIKDQVRQADVIIFVLNTSHKRTPDMGFKAFKQIFPENYSETCMLVTTHGNTHYRAKGTAELLEDINESPDICEFLHRISGRAVIVELGDGQQSEDAILDGNAVYDKERDQAMQLVMAMVKQIVKKRNAYKRMGRENPDPRGSKGRLQQSATKDSKFV